jgi:hypothetical protein
LVWLETPDVEIIFHTDFAWNPLQLTTGNSQTFASSVPDFCYQVLIFASLYMDCQFDDHQFPCCWPPCLGFCSLARCQGMAASDHDHLQVTNCLQGLGYIKTYSTIRFVKQFDILLPCWKKMSKDLISYTFYWKV